MAGDAVVISSKDENHKLNGLTATIIGEPMLHSGHQKYPIKIHVGAQVFKLSQEWQNEMRKNFFKCDAPYEEIKLLVSLL